MTLARRRLQYCEKLGHNALGKMNSSRHRDQSDRRIQKDNDALTCMAAELGETLGS